MGKKPPSFHPNIRILFMFLIMFVIAGFLRFYRITETIKFLDDQGLDLMSIWLIEKSGNFPLVGPFLSIPEVHTPPTYYVLTWAMYHLTRSVEGVVFGYALLNMITIGLLTFLTRKMMGVRAAFFICIMLTASNIMIEHSRSFWQPYPIQLFIAIFLVTLWYAQQSNRWLIVWIAVFFYQLALSIYPSPLLLLPFVMYRTYHWYRNIQRRSFIVSVSLTLCIFLTTGLIVFSPQLIFEVLNKFPTLTSLLSVHGQQTITEPITNAYQNISALVITFFGTNILSDGHKTTMTTLLLTLLVLMGYLLRKKYATTETNFIPFWTLAGGLTAFIFFPLDAHGHRTWAYLPFAFLRTADILNRSWQHNHITRLLCILFLISFVGLNITGSIPNLTHGTPDRLKQARQTAEYIQNDITTRGVPHDSVGIFYKIPNDPHNGTYGIYTILVWLVQNGVSPFSFYSDHVHIPHDYSTPVLKPYMYIICNNFHPAAIDSACVSPVIGPVLYRQLVKQKLDNKMIVILSAESISEEHDKKP